MTGKRSRRRCTVLWWFLAGPLVVLLSATLWAWPYLAITETTGSEVLVVEGWLEADAMRQAAQLIEDRGYTRIYTTGTARPFAYLLYSGHGVSVDLYKPLQGKITVEATGLPGAGFVLTAGPDTLLDEQVAAGMSAYQARTGPVDHLHVVCKGPPDPGGVPQVFIRSLAIDGVNVNMLQVRSSLTRPDDTSEPATPSYARSARNELVELGIPGGQITAVPAYGQPRSRSWGNAHAFNIQARIDEIEAFDVATLGVHARRSHKLFKAAVGPGVRVGVIALEDPACARNNWWKSRHGWTTMLKEVLGVPEADVVELKRWSQTVRNNGDQAP